MDITHRAVMKKQKQNSMVVAQRHIISTDFGAHYHFLTCSANKEIM